MSCVVCCVFPPSQGHRDEHQTALVLLHAITIHQVLEVLMVLHLLHLPAAPPSLLQIIRHQRRHIRQPQFVCCHATLHTWKSSEKPQTVHAEKPPPPSNSSCLTAAYVWSGPDPPLTPRPTQRGACHPRRRILAWRLCAPPFVLIGVMSVLGDSGLCRATPAVCGEPSGCAASTRLHLVAAVLHLYNVKL